MRSAERMKWVAVAAVAALAAACSKGGEEAANTMADTMAATAPAPAPTETTPGAAAPAGGAVPANLPAGVTADMINQGREIFHGPGNCYTCHGPDAKGTALAPDLTDTQYLNLNGDDYQAYIALIKAGVPQPKQHPAPMPPMGGATLTDAQVNAVASYEWALSHGGTP